MSLEELLFTNQFAKWLLMLFRPVFSCRNLGIVRQKLLILCLGTVILLASNHHLLAQTIDSSHDGFRNASPSTEDTLSLPQSQLLENISLSNVKSVLTPSDAMATIGVKATSFGIDASTFGSNSFRITNESPSANITSVVYDMTTGFIPNLVFDPNGTAGDLGGKTFTEDSNTGGDNNIDVLSHSFGAPLGNGGFQELTINFDDFEPGETFGFSADQDPISLEGLPGSQLDEAGAISGLEQVGATITITFDDGSVFTNTLYNNNRPPGAVSTVKEVIQAAPTIQAVGLSSPSTVSDPSQLIRVSGGPANGFVSLLRVEAELILGNNGYVADPYEVNKAVVVDRMTGIALDANGTVDVSVTLTNAGDSTSGFNYFIAAIEDGGDFGFTSNTVVLKYEPGCSLTANLVASETVTCAGDTVTFTASGGATYEFFVNDLSQGIPSATATFTTSTLVNGDQVVVVASDGSSCSDTSSVINMTVHPLPDFDIADPMICADAATDFDLTILEPVGQEGGVWKDALDQVVSTVTVTDEEEFIYTYTNANSCSASDTIAFTVHPLPTAQISGTSTICQGENATLTFTGTPGDSVIYNDGLVNDTVLIQQTGTVDVTVSPTATTTYELVGAFDENGCMQMLTGSAIITILAVPDPTGLAFQVGDICTGEDAVGSISGAIALPDSDYTITYNLDGGSPQTSLVTIMNGAGSFSISGLMMPSYTINLTAIEAANGCASTLTGISDDLIVNDPLISVGDVDELEGEAEDTLIFAVTLSSICTDTVSVNYATVDGSATAGMDYEQQQGTVEFHPGNLSANIEIVILGDTELEDDETFLINLSAASGATILDGQAVGTIINDDTLALCVQDTLKVTNNSVTGYIDAGTYRAEVIVSDGTVEAGTTVSFYASQSIELVKDVIDDNATDPDTTIGFTVEPTGQFSAKIEACASFLPLAGGDENTITNRTDDDTFDTKRTSLQPPWLKVEPNPATDFMYIRFHVPAYDFVTIRLLNQMGQQVAFPVQQQIFDKGEHNLLFYPQQLPAGMYFIQLNTSKERITAKVMIL